MTAYESHIANLERTLIRNDLISQEALDSVPKKDRIEIIEGLYRLIKAMHLGNVPVLGEQYKPKTYKEQVKEKIRDAHNKEYFEKVNDLYNSSLNEEMEDLYNQLISGEYFEEETAKPIETPSEIPVLEEIDFSLFSNSEESERGTQDWGEEVDTEDSDNDEEVFKEDEEDNWGEELDVSYEEDDESSDDWGEEVDTEQEEDDDFEDDDDDDFEEEDEEDDDFEDNSSDDWGEEDEEEDDDEEEDSQWGNDEDDFEDEEDDFEDDDEEEEDEQWADEEDYEDEEEDEDEEDDEQWADEEDYIEDDDEEEQNQNSFKQSSETSSFTVPNSKGSNNQDIDSVKGKLSVKSPSSNSKTKTKEDKTADFILGLGDKVLGKFTGKNHNKK